jgi:Holliday junction resolvase RusA-like endonuclease
MQFSKDVFPSPDGITKFIVNVKPISLQSNRENKDAVTKAIQMITSTSEIILTGDIQVVISWYINEDKRYETNDSPDIDNIIKPILDSLTGPNGIMVNDCQIQSVHCYWCERYIGLEHIEIEIKYEADMFEEKKSLAFVNVKNGLCMPININIEPASQKLLLDIFEKQLKSRDELVKKSLNPSLARGVLSIQRFFHISHCHGFSIYKIDYLRKLINS